MAYDIRNFPRAENKITVNAVDGFNSNIIETISKNFFIAVGQTRGMAQQFRGDTRLATAFNIWAFLKRNIKYKRDTELYQDVRMPGRLLQDREGDCKSFSLMAAALLKNLAMPVAFRYVSYKSDPTPTHVYVITWDKDGTQIILDAVYDKFNKEATFRSKRDYLMKQK